MSHLVQRHTGSRDMAPSPNLTSFALPRSGMRLVDPLRVHEVIATAL